MSLHGKVAIVTGASRGIGKRIALLLAKEGAKVVIAARTTDRGDSPYPGTLEETAAEIRSLGAEALPVKCDLAVRSDVERLCTSAIDKFGRVEILINNAVYTGPGHYERFLNVTLDQWETMMGANFMASAIACRLTLPYMVKQKTGIIICMTSAVAAGEVAGPAPYSVAYPAAKAALNRFVQCLAGEIREHNVSIVAVDPGFTLTERAYVVSPRMGFDLAAAHPMEVPAKVVHWLCTCQDPMKYTGRVLDAEQFVKDHAL